MKVGLLFLSLLHVSGGLILPDLLDVHQTTFLVNSLVQAYGLQVTEDQCVDSCHGLYNDYPLDITCNFVCSRIKAEIARRLVAPTLKPTAAPTPGPMVQITPTAGDSELQ